MKLIYTIVKNSFLQSSVKLLHASVASTSKTGGGGDAERSWNFVKPVHQYPDQLADASPVKADLRAAETTVARSSRAFAEALRA